MMIRVKSLPVTFPGLSGFPHSQVTRSRILAHDSTHACPLVPHTHAYAAMLTRAPLPLARVWLGFGRGVQL